MRKEYDLSKMKGDKHPDAEELKAQVTIHRSPGKLQTISRHWLEEPACRIKI